MKRFVIALITIGLLFSFAYAGVQQPPKEKKPVNIPEGIRLTPKRNVPAFTFTKVPTPVATNFYDYMIGSYNGLPLRVIPNVAGGGYFMTWHGKAEASAQSTRRMYYTYLDGNCNVITNNTISPSQIHEGYGTVVVDPVSGKPFYAWHANNDTDADLEVVCYSDAFIAGTDGLWNNYGSIIDNPFTLGDTTDNEFIWPTAVIGLSPQDGMRRLYVVARNSVSHYASTNPCENPIIAYADFDGAMIQAAQPLDWHYTDIPEITAWNVHQTEFRRPFLSIAVDDAGNLYYAGYHFAYEGDDSTSIVEEDMDVFMCDNYGEGTWRRVTAWSNFPMDNPPEAPGSDVGYFQNQNNQPYQDGEIEFSVNASASGHCNTIVDGLGRVQTMGVWSLSTNEGTYYPALQFMKSFVYDPANDQIKVNEIYPQKDPSDDVNECFVPWDFEEPWGVPEYGYYEDNDGNMVPYLQVVTDWPFPYWDIDAHGQSMTFHYNNAKLSEDNEWGMMVALWQNSWRARQYNENNIQDYYDYQDTPEIWIAVSPDHGNTWSEPIVLENQNVLEFQGIKPMWAYPADKVLYTRMEGNQKVGRIGVMFYNDNTWGSAVLAEGPIGTVDGGQVMFMELEIVFPEGGPNPHSNDGYTQTPALKLLGQNYPNPFNPTTTINYTMNRAGDANLSVYNVKGQLVNTLVNGNKEAGHHSIVWDGTDSRGNDVPSGIYFYRFTTGNHVETKKMMLMK